ncbi:MAG: septation protein A [Rhodoferax sp.]|nr:septation protein A [Rhodoferax sp.]MBP9928348.1 septation protein A [Rhodoferax sp.]HQX59641.1 septation protein A [Burkholderiaceae bacterium]HQZ04757.1 septation protein A [Burkholderiaceae bacterium]HRA61160.1 septation protein A [Burkholderiaceae bacterium]
MKILIDFFPILLFFGAYKFYDIYAATGVLMAATVVQTAIMYAVDRKVTTMQKITLGMILAFGALTLYLHDERFIKWKPTVLYAAIAIALTVTVWVFKKSFLKLMLGAQLDLPDRIWMHLNIAWILYSVLMAAVNAYVAMYFSTEAWVNFKLWGYVFPLAFIIGQGFYISPHLKGSESEAGR